MFPTMATTAPVAIIGLIMFVSSIIGLRVDLTIYLSILCIVGGGIVALMGGLIFYDVGGWVFLLLLIMGIVSIVVGALPLVILALLRHFQVP